MTSFALQRSGLVEQNRLAVHYFGEAMALVARDSLVAAFERKLRFAVIEAGGLPTLGIVAARAFCLLRFGELLAMNIHVAGLASDGSPFKLNLLLPGKGFVAIVTRDGAMDAKQRELGFRMVEPGHVNP